MEGGGDDYRLSLTWVCCTCWILKRNLQQKVRIREAWNNRKYPVKRFAPRTASGYPSRYEGGDSGHKKMATPSN